MRSKQRVNDSFSVFLRKVRKKEGGTIVGTKSHGGPVEILKVLIQGNSARIEELASELNESAYNISTMVRELETSNLVIVEPDTDIVTLTDTGRTVASYQDLLAK